MTGKGRKGYEADPSKSAAYYEMYRQGFSCAEIAKAFGVSRNGVWDQLNRYGYRLRQKKELPSVVFDGHKYTANSHGYYRRTCREKHVSLHREVWRYHKGEIPDGFDVHHINGDKQDNRIENLECISKSEHTKIHKPKRPCHGKKVINLDTGKTFESLVSAAHSLSVTPQSISCAIKRGGKCCGVNWAYINE